MQLHSLLRSKQTLHLKISLNQNCENKRHGLQTTGATNLIKNSQRTEKNLFQLSTPATFAVLHFIPSVPIQVSRTCKYISFFSTHHSFRLLLRVQIIWSQVGKIRYNDVHPEEKMPILLREKNGALMDVIYGHIDLCWIWTELLEYFIIMSIRHRIVYFTLLHTELLCLKNITTAYVNVTAYYALNLKYQFLFISFISALVQLSIQLERI